MLRILPAVHEHDRERIDPAAPYGSQAGPRLFFVERPDDLSAGADPLFDLEHLLVRLLGEDDTPGKDFRARLVADPQSVAETAGDRQCDTVALAFEQGVGRYRGSHPDRGDVAAPALKDSAHRLERGVRHSATGFRKAASRQPARRQASARSRR
jgi:hypothetical protein